MDISLAWILDPRTPLWLETEGRKYLGAIHVEMLVDFVHLTSEAQLKGIRGHYPALKGALDAMGRVVDRIHRERWEAEQSQLARAGAPMCSICMEYGHVEANCHDPEEDTDSDLEWEEHEVQNHNVCGTKSIVFLYVLLIASSVMWAALLSLLFVKYSQIVAKFENYISKDSQIIENVTKLENYVYKEC
ncbi:UNVERIFIED_CONTAM: hypothetical protein FKN15_062144 [Acipenser sinensis]